MYIKKPRYNVSQIYNKYTWDIFLKGLEELSENTNSFWKSQEKISNEVNFLSLLDIHLLHKIMFLILKENVYFR